MPAIPAAAPYAAVDVVVRNPGAADAVGAALFTRHLVAKARKSRLALGSVSCPRAAAATCTVTVTGTLKVGKARFALSTSATVKHGAHIPIAFTLTRRASRALKSTGGLSLKTGVVDDTGLKGTATALATAVRA